MKVYIATIEYEFFNKKCCTQPMTIEKKKKKKKRNAQLKSS